MTTVTAPIDLTSLAGDAITSQEEDLTGIQCRMVGWLYFATVAAAPGDAAHVETQARLRARSALQRMHHGVCMFSSAANLVPAVHMKLLHAVIVSAKV